MSVIGLGKVCWAIAPEALQLISAGAYPGLYSIKQLGVLLPLEGKLVHCRLHPQLLLVLNYSWVERSN